MKALRSYERDCHAISINMPVGARVLSFDFRLLLPERTRVRLWCLVDLEDPDAPVEERHFVLLSQEESVADDLAYVVSGVRPLVSGPACCHLFERVSAQTKSEDSPVDRLKQTVSELEEDIQRLRDRVERDVERLQDRVDALDGRDSRALFFSTWTD